MDRNIKKLIKEKIKVALLKKEFNKQAITKSILQNNNVYIHTKLYTRYTLSKVSKKHNWVSRINKICLQSGKLGGVSKNYMLSRYTIKNLVLNNRFSNITQSKK